MYTCAKTLQILDQKSHAACFRTCIPTPTINYASVHLLTNIIKTPSPNRRLLHNHVTSQQVIVLIYINIDLHVYPIKYFNMPPISHGNSKAMIKP